MRFPILLLFAFSVGCSSPAPSPADSSIGLDGASNLDGDVCKYPPGPYPATQGAVVSDVQLRGKRYYTDSAGTATTEVAHPIAFHDYFCDKTTKVLVVFVSTENCVPCRNEQADAITLYNDYLSTHSGVALLEVIIQDNQGNIADDATVDRWATNTWNPGALKINFDMANDPTLSLLAYYNPSVFPTQLVIHKSDMNLRWQNTGAVTKDQLKAQIDAALN